jgi:hypothetical protein
MVNDRYETIAEIDQRPKRDIAHHPFLDCHRQAIGCSRVKHSSAAWQLPHLLHDSSRISPRLRPKL